MWNGTLTWGQFEDLSLQMIMHCAEQVYKFSMSLNLRQTLNCRSVLLSSIAATKAQRVAPKQKMCLHLQLISGFQTSHKQWRKVSSCEWWSRSTSIIEGEPLFWKKVIWYDYSTRWQQNFIFPGIFSIMFPGRATGGPTSSSLPVETNEEQHRVRM